MKLDWDLLRKQKLYLLKQANDPARVAGEVEVFDGVIHLIDAIQDEAVKKGDATELEVFGEEEVEEIITREEMVEALINDAANTCQQDTKYLFSILQNYFGSLSGDAVLKLYREAFEE